MSQPTDQPAVYTVSYAERVRTELVELLQRASARGVGRQALDAVKRIDYLLSVYPQFGEPLFDLATPGETAWIGVVGPLVVKYVVDDKQRQVFVITPIKPFRHLGP